MGGKVVDHQQVMADLPEGRRLILLNLEVRNPGRAIACKGSLSLCHGNVQQACDSAVDLERMH